MVSSVNSNGDIPVNGGKSPFSASGTETESSSTSVKGKFVNSSWMELAAKENRTESEEKQLYTEYREACKTMAKNLLVAIGAKDSGNDTSITFEEFTKAFLPEDKLRAAGLSKKEIKQAYKEYLQMFQECYDLNNDRKLDVNEVAAWMPAIDENNGQYDGHVDDTYKDLMEKIPDATERKELRTRIENAYNQFIVDQE